MEALLLSYNSDESAVLRLALQRVGLSVQIVTEIDIIVSNWQNYSVDLIALTFPKIEIPINAIKQLRAYTEVPVVIICETLVEDYHVKLLEAGIDLVLFRPVSARLFIAQVRGLLRRVLGIPLFSLPVLSRGDILLDPSDRTVQVGVERPKRLTQLEFRLLFTLMTNAGQTISSERLVEHVWGYSGRGDRNLVRGLVKRLRDKIETSPTDPSHIVTVPGSGYLFRP